MIRGDNIICGTTTTGTGTLTLAATPVPPGGVDFDVFARATGIGFANSAAVLVSYTIIEYTDATFATAKATEKGTGILTLGGSSGITNATLARTIPQSTATSLNVQPATQNIAPGAGISIGTGANTLVFIGASAADILAFSNHFTANAPSGGDAPGAMPLNGGSVGSPQNLSNNQFFYVPFVWCITTLVKRATVWVGTAYTGGTTNMWGRLYDVAGSGTFIGGPGKLLYDFGLFGSSGTSLNSLGILQTGAAGNGFFLTPGDYYLCLGVGFTGGSGVPALRTTSLVHLGRLGSNMALNNDPGALAVPIAAGTPSGTPDDPAVTAGLGIWGFSCFGFALNSS